MPNIATKLYRRNPGLQVLLDFLGRCEPDGERLIAHYQHAHELAAVKAAWTNSGIQPPKIVPAPDPGKVNAHTNLALDHADSLALSRHAMPLLAQELRLRLPAISAALKLAPVHWNALRLRNRALSAWGVAAGMVALPTQTVFDYLGSRYPSDAEQRGRYSVIKDAEHAAGYKKNNALGFLINTGDMQDFACHGDDWRREVSSARLLVNHHLGLMLKIGLQMLDAGADDALKDLSSVLLLAGDTPPLVKLQTLLETYQDHIAIHGADQHGFRNKLLKNCLGNFEQWQIDCKLTIAYGPSIADRLSPIVSPGERKSTDASASAARKAPVPDIPPASPALASPASRNARPPDAGRRENQVDATPVKAKADPVIAEGVTIPKNVTVAAGAHVRICDISTDTRLKPGTVLHGDVSIASHTSFDGPVTIMNDVRVGRGLKFGSGLILSEGATISTFAVRCALPQGTRIAGNLRIGDGSSVGKNVSFGAENWLGDRVHVGANVRFGNWVRVDSGISIGANARIKGPARLVGDIPENAEITGTAMGGPLRGSTQDDCPHVLNVPVFTIAKNETIHNRPATPREPLASTALNIDGELQEKAPRLAAQGLRAPKAPTGGQRKRKADAIVGRDTKRIRINLESRYRDAEVGRSPVPAMDAPHTGPRYVAPVPPSGKSAGRAVEAVAPSRPDVQEPMKRPSGAAPVSTAPVAPPVRRRADSAPAQRHQAAAGISTAPRQPAPAVPRAPQPPPGSNAQRKAWQQSITDQKKQSALEQAMRTSIRLPARGAGSEAPRPLQAGAPPILRPVYDSKAPKL